MTDLCKNLIHILGELGYKNTKYWVANRIAQFILTFWLKVVLLSYVMFTKTMYSVDGFDSVEYTPAQGELIEKNLLKAWQAMVWCYYLLNLGGFLDIMRMTFNLFCQVDKLKRN